MFELRVLSGLHLGAALPLFGESWLIGHAEEADLMLSDAHVAARHCQLRSTGTGWQIQPDGGEASGINPEEAFQIADVWLCVARTETPWAACMPPASPPQPDEPAAATPEHVPPAAARKGIFPRTLRTLAWSLMLLLTLTVMSWVLQPTVAQTQVTAPRSQHTHAAMQAPLQKMLRERDLARVVKLDMHNQRLRLRGHLTQSQMQIFNRMLARFNATYPSETPLNNQVRLLKVRLPFRIVQITTGSRANIVTDEGQRLFVGDEVDNLRLVAITPDQIEFNGRENIKVSW
ncbi:type III secretion protein [Pantoea anthophila]|uniref:FHA domain-containing protein n=1 Tax=Pantoea anthophila TaxID=470931 RepID=UPI002DBC6237|nr:FHA domain-containing protein [Pantoea anthophila]MEB7539514.1 type III secretion protein [Pantoea anthophila]